MKENKELDYRKIDALVAEHIMEFEFYISGDDVRIKLDGTGAFVCFSPSRNISAAWQVVEKLSPTHCYTICDFGKNKHKKKPHYARFIELKSFNTADDYLPRAETVPLAICLASLKVKGIDTNENNKH